MNKNDRWGTPPYYISLAKEVLGSIDVDPASESCFNAIVGAKKFYTEAENGLLLPWEGRVWCNPPYSAVLIKKFTAKRVEEFNNGNMVEGIILTNAGTDTLWNKPLYAGVQAYTVGRISFMQPDGSYKSVGSRGQCFTYFGQNISKFIDVFTRDGKCWVPNRALIKS
jgi:hypothetical protein